MKQAPLTPMARLRWPLIVDALSRRGSAFDALEIGYGQGAIAQRLAVRYRRYRGYEPDAQSHAVAVERTSSLPGIELICDLLPEEADRQFDIACAFEVLEHLEDDLEALRNWRKWLKGGGLLVLSVPAHQRRFGPADRLVGHHRRYEKHGLSDLLERAGYVDVRVVSYAFPLGYLLEAVRNRLASQRTSTTKAEGTAVSGRFLQPKTWLDTFIVAGVWPFILIQKPFSRTDLGTGFVASAFRGPDEPHA